MTVTLAAAARRVARHRPSTNGGLVGNDHRLTTVDEHRRSCFSPSDTENARPAGHPCPSRNIRRSPQQSRLEQRVPRRTAIETTPTRMTTTSSQPRRSNLDEAAYLNLVREVLEHGTLRLDRTKTGTLSLFGKQLRYSLRNGTVPLLTTKMVNWRFVKAELFWFLKGSTNANDLIERGIRIWQKNSTREFLDSRGLHGNPEGDLGPVYGFQWRHFGATYRGANVDYTGEGYDQLAEVVRLLREEPNSRRIMLSAWNPNDLASMALPPCHVSAQFDVTAGRQLRCLVFQRSADLGLGVPYNIAVYSLLTHMLAHVCHLEAVELIHSMGNCHVYLNHVNGLKTQLQRAPKPFPKIAILRKPGELDDLEEDDVELFDYFPEPSIHLSMAV